MSTWFPVVVSQYCNRTQLRTAPSQNRTCAVNASGSPRRLALREGSRCAALAPSYHFGSGSVSRKCPIRNAPTLGRLPSASITRLHRYYAAFGLPECRLPPSLLQLVGHTRPSMMGLHVTSKNFRVSLVVLMPCCVTRMGLRLRVSDRSSPWRGDQYCLPV